MDYNIKSLNVLVLGDKGVGKSYFISQLLDGCIDIEDANPIKDRDSVNVLSRYTTHYIQTVEDSAFIRYSPGMRNKTKIKKPTGFKSVLCRLFGTKTVVRTTSLCLQDVQTVNFSISEVGGSTEFRSLYSSSIKSSDAFMLVFNYSDKKSLKFVYNICDHISKIKRRPILDIPILIIENDIPKYPGLNTGTCYCTDKLAELVNEGYGRHSVVSNEEVRNFSKIYGIYIFSTRQDCNTSICLEKILDKVRYLIGKIGTSFSLVANLENYLNSVDYILSCGLIKPTTNRISRRIAAKRYKLKGETGSKDTLVWMKGDDNDVVRVEINKNDNNGQGYEYEERKHTIQSYSKSNRNPTPVHLKFRRRKFRVLSYTQLYTNSNPIPSTGPTLNPLISHKRDNLLNLRWRSHPELNKNHHENLSIKMRKYDNNLNNSNNSYPNVTELRNLNQSYIQPPVSNNLKSHTLSEHEGSSLSITVRKTSPLKTESTFSCVRRNSLVIVDNVHQQKVSESAINMSSVSHATLSISSDEQVLNKGSESPMLSDDYICNIWNNKSSNNITTCYCVPTVTHELTSACDHTIKKISNTYSYKPYHSSEALKCLSRLPFHKIDKLLPFKKIQSDSNISNQPHRRSLSIIN